MCTRVEQRRRHCSGELSCVGVGQLQRAVPRQAATESKFGSRDVGHFPRHGDGAQPGFTSGSLTGRISTMRRILC